MKAEDIIEGLNRYIEDRRKELNINVNGHLVLQRSITPSPTFKAYKFYEVIVWYVKGRTKSKVLHFTETAKMIDGQEEKINRSINVILSSQLFSWINSKECEQVIKGEII